MQITYLKSGKYYLAVFIFLLVLFYSLKGAAMSLLFGTEVVLFSPMEGTITYEGKPAANAKIVVHVFWKDEIGEKEEFFTNENGKFSLPIKKTRVRIPPLTEFVVTQQVTVIFHEQEFVIWYKSLLDNDEYGGLGGLLQNVTCEITDERESKKGLNGIFSTSCKWTNVINKGTK